MLVCYRERGAWGSAPEPLKELYPTFSSNPLTLGKKQENNVNPIKRMCLPTVANFKFSNSFSYQNAGMQSETVLLKSSQHSYDQNTKAREKNVLTVKEYTQKHW